MPYSATLKRTRPSWRCVVVAVVCLAAAAGPPHTTALAQDELQVVAVRPNFYVISGAGSNIGVQIGPLGVVVVDTGSSAAADKALAAIKRLTSERIRYILNTGPDSDHVGGNATLSKAGLTILANVFGGTAASATAAPSGPLGLAGIVSSFEDRAGASVLMTDNAFQRVLAASPNASIADYTRSFTSTHYSMYLNGEGIQVLHQPAAHSDGDAFVVFRKNDVIMTGDIVDLEKFPVIDVARGGSIQGEVAALNRLVDMTIPGFPLPWQEGRTIVVPGHGHVMDYADLVRYRDMVIIIRDRVADLIAQGRTLPQIQEANPTQGYRQRYGSDAGPWTTSMFVEAIYRSLLNHKESK